MNHVIDTDNLFFCVHHLSPLYFVADSPSHMGQYSQLVSVPPGVQPYLYDCGPGSRDAGHGMYLLLGPLRDLSSTL